MTGAWFGSWQWLRNLAWGLLPILLWAVGLALFTWHRTLEQAKGDWQVALGIIGSIFWPVALLLCVIYVVLGIFASLARRRDATLVATRKARLVVPSLRTRALVQSLEEAGLTGAYGSRPRDFPYGLSAVLTERGLELWGGGYRDPVKHFSVRWSSVHDVHRGLVPDGARQLHAVVVSLAKGRREAAVPLVLVGSGLFGLFQPSARHIDQVVDTMKSLALEQAEDKS